jgi:hypothetical protein
LRSHVVIEITTLIERFLAAEGQSFGTREVVPDHQVNVE